MSWCSSMAVGFCNDTEHVGLFNEYSSAIGCVLNGTLNGLGMILLNETK